MIKAVGNCFGVRIDTLRLAPYAFTLFTLLARLTLTIPKATVVSGGFCVLCVWFALDGFLLPLIALFMLFMLFMQ